MEFSAILLLGLMFLMLIVSPLGKISPAAILAGSWGTVYFLQSLFASDMVSSVVATMAIFSITLAFSAGELIGCAWGGGGHGSRMVLTVPLVDESCESAKKFKKVVIFLV
jgi:hypothetical protein